MKYFAAALTDIGIKRKVNQDGVCIRIVDTKERGCMAMAVLCDGMGGFSKGELASSTVIKGFYNWFEQLISTKEFEFDRNQLKRQWMDMIHQQNIDIMSYAQREDLKMGTTLSAIFIYNDKYMTMHVGDSRIYEITGETRRLTNDHTLVAREVLKGILTEEEARVDSRRNILLQCIGAMDKLAPEISFGDIMPDSVMLLCSDGLHHTFRDHMLAERIKPQEMNRVGDLHKACSKLIAEAKAGDEKDNITAAMIKCSDSSNGRTTKCNADTANEVELIQDIMFIHSDEVIR